MPTPIKLLVSIVVACVAGAFMWVEHTAGQAHLGYIGLGLGGFMIFAVWLFPETKRQAGDG